MKIGKLTLSESLSILHDQTIGRLGCILNGEPYVVPVSYLFDGKDIFIHSLPGAKIDALRANPRACLQVDEIKDAYQWRSTIAYGSYEEITDDESRAKILADLFKRFPHLTPVETKKTDQSVSDIVFRLRVDEITGVGEEW